MQRRFLRTRLLRLAKSAQVTGEEVEPGAQSDGGSRSGSQGNHGKRSVLTLKDFRSIYEHECDINPWSVDYDFVEYEVDWEDTGDARPLFGD